METTASMPGDQIPVVVVARNNLQLTKRTVASALNQDVPVELLVVDNASSDGTAAWLSSKTFARIHTGEQWSLAKCWNVALKALWKAGHERALVLNNDLEIAKCTARTLDAINGPFVTCVSVGSAEQFDADIQPDIEELRAGARPHPDYSCWMIRKSVTDRNIWFNEECWPGYCEDSFHHKALHDAGIHAMCVSLPFLHHGSSTLKNADEGEASRIRRGADANRARFKAKYGCLPGTPEYEELFA